MKKKLLYLCPCVHHFAMQAANMCICTSTIQGGSLNDMEENAPEGEWTFDD